MFLLKNKNAKTKNQATKSVQKTRDCLESAFGVLIRNAELQPDFMKSLIFAASERTNTLLIRARQIDLVDCFCVYLCLHDKQGLHVEKHYCKTSLFYSQMKCSKTTHTYFIHMPCTRDCTNLCAHTQENNSKQSISLRIKCFIVFSSKFVHLHKHQQSLCSMTLNK